MNRERKIRTPVTLFASIESAQHDALRKIAFDQRRSLADLVVAVDDLTADEVATRILDWLARHGG